MEYDLPMISAACDVSRRTTPVGIYLPDGFHRRSDLHADAGIPIHQRGCTLFLRIASGGSRVEQRYTRSRHLIPFSLAFVLSADVSYSIPVPRFMSSVGLTTLPDNVFADLSSLVTL